MSPRRFRRAVGPATVALLTLGLLAVAPQFSSPASAQGSSRSCATPVTSAPSGRATVATASTSFGRVLVVGSGANADCSLYVLTSDQLHSLTSGRAHYACGDGPNVLGHPCDGDDILTSDPGDLQALAQAAEIHVELVPGLNLVARLPSTHDIRHESAFDGAGSVVALSCDITWGRK